MTQVQIEQFQKFIELLSNPWFALGFAVLMVWALFWKGIALWKAAKNNNKIWFVVMLIANTIGVLEIIYIFLISNKNQQSNE